MIQEHFKNILTRGLPKTGQVTSYYNGDDGYYQAGWWLRRLISNNRTRFVAKKLTMLQHPVVIDRATGLMWVKSGQKTTDKTWENALVYANNLWYAGFEDWRIPNIREALSIMDYSKYDPAIDENFFTPNSEYYWTSTTCKENTTKAWVVHILCGELMKYPKTDDGTSLRCVRGGVGIQI